VIPVRNREAPGFSDSEKYLAQLCEETFLSLWSHPNLFRARNKELADLIVIFGNDVLIFSDKCCRFPTGELKLAWQRWYRRAVRSSAKQLRRAAAWVRKHPGQIFLDARCEVAFPLPFPSRPRLHLIAVAVGAAEACRREHGGSGSLIVSSDISEVPFHTCDLDPGADFVHVLDDVALDCLIRELDTVSDFLAYLSAREAFIRSGRFFGASGEEDLVGCYLSRVDDDGNHAFVFGGDERVILGEGFYSRLVGSDEYARRKEADEISYLWDGLIEHVAQNAMAGALVVGAEQPLAAHEEGLRIMAAEPRVARRGLAKCVRTVGTYRLDQTMFARFIEGDADRPGYLLMRLNNEVEDYDVYRRTRLNMLEAYTLVTKDRHRDTREIVSIGFDRLDSDDQSVDMLYTEFPEWTPAQSAHAEQLRRKLGWKDRSQLRRVAARESEYPEQRRRRKVGRNEPCPCGSGIKYKKCCLS